MSPEEQLSGFIAKFTPDIAKKTHLALEKMRALLPGAIELVYDNYNALAIGFGPSERASDAIFSIAVFPRWVSLFFLHGATLADPANLLKGGGKVARHIVLTDIEILDSTSVRTLITAALTQAAHPIDASRPNQLVIKSVSAKQRPRRPA